VLYLFRYNTIHSRHNKFCTDKNAHTGRTHGPSHGATVFQSSGTIKIDSSMYICMYIYISRASLPFCDHPESSQRLKKKSKNNFMYELNFTSIINERLWKDFQKIFIPNNITWDRKHQKSQIQKDYLWMNSKCTRGFENCRSVHVYIQTRTHTFMYICIHLYVCTHIHTYVCVHTFIYVCVCVCIYKYIGIRI